MNSALEYLADNKAKAVDQLSAFLSIPSVSTDPAQKQQVDNCATWLFDHLEEIGFPKVTVFPTKGHPIVYAEDLAAGNGAPTILFYGHYDVQPADPIELWTSDPFTPSIRNGKIYARGATDDKGQVFAHIKAIEAMYKSGKPLPLNIKFLIEGEEEVGSKHLDSFVKENTTLLKCDAVVVSDSSMFAPGKPSLVYGLRGMAYLQLDVQGPNRDLHSGSFGGPVQNPINALAWILAALKDQSGNVMVPGFYDDVLEISKKELDQLLALGMSDERLKVDAGVTGLGGEKGFTSVEKLWTRPTLDVNGILGGFTGEGAKTVLPAKAMAKISMRLVPNQSHVDIAKKVEEFIGSMKIPGVKVTVTNLHGADPVLVPTDTEAMNAAVKALRDTFDTDVVFQREGGSIPVVLLFEKILNAPTVLMGFGLNNENAHSPDEHFDLQNFHFGSQAAVRFYTYFARSTPK
ncbi:MAG: dipeptidase [Ignavibacteria bacterium]|nr:dipeptidase [Ignavibacteria bacterium]